MASNSYTLIIKKIQTSNVNSFKMNYESMFTSKSISCLWEKNNCLVWSNLLHTVAICLALEYCTSYRALTFVGISSFRAVKTSLQQKRNNRRLGCTGFSFWNIYSKYYSFHLLWEVSDHIFNLWSSIWLNLENLSSYCCRTLVWIEVIVASQIFESPNECKIGHKNT